MAEPGVNDKLLTKLIVDSATMQGRFAKQEDRHVKIPDLTRAAAAFKMPIDHLDQPCALFAVYDGHRGHACADFAAKGFHGRFLRKLSADKGEEARGTESISSMMQEVCHELDAEWLAKHRTVNDGCTLCVVFVTGQRLFTCWLGDVRCTLAREGEDGSISAIPVTEDHRPNVEAEAKRIKSSGGTLIDCGYGMMQVALEDYDERLRDMRRAQLQGISAQGKEPIALDVSRTLGDRDFKTTGQSPILISTPSVRMVELDASYKFLSLVSSGVSLAMDEAEIVWEIDLLREKDLSTDVRAGCGAAVQEAYGRGSGHNLTTIVARMLWQGATEVGYKRKMANIEKAKVAAMLEGQVEKQSAGTASKKRRLEAAAAVSAQKVAAYERDAAPDNAAAEAKKQAEVDKMRREVEAEKAEVARKSRAEALKKAAEAEKMDNAAADQSVDSAAEAFFAANRKKREGAAVAEQREGGAKDSAMDSAEAFFEANRRKRQEEREEAARKAAETDNIADATKQSVDSAAEAFFAANRKKREAAAESGKCEGVKESAMDSARRKREVKLLPVESAPKVDLPSTPAQQIQQPAAAEVKVTPSQPKTALPVECSPKIDLPPKPAQQTQQPTTAEVKASPSDTKAEVADDAAEDDGLVFL